MAPMSSYYQKSLISANSDKLVHLVKMENIVDNVSKQAV